MNGAGSRPGLMGSAMDPRSGGNKSMGRLQDPHGSHDQEATDPCNGCGIQISPTIQRPQIAVGVQDPHGSDDPDATDSCEGRRIKMDPTIQGSHNLEGCRIQSV